VTDRSSSDHSRRNTAFYAQALLAGSGFDLQAGVRLDANQVFGRFATWRAGAVARPIASLRLHLAAGSAFKQPTFSEQFANTPYEVGNPSLVPERALSWEAGVEGSLAERRLTASVTWFDQTFQDLIQYQEAPAGEPTYANVARARARGLEVGGAWSPVTTITIKAQATLLRTRVEDTGEAGPAFEAGRPLLRRPGTYWTAGVLWRPWPGATLGLDFQRTGERDDVDYSGYPASRVSLGGYSLLNLFTDLPVTRAGTERVALTLQVQNATGTSYQTVVGFPGRPRAVLAGIRVGR
jgi:vitamin B12 transporter